MLFVNLDIIIELLGRNIDKCSKENRLLYYNKIANTTLEEDIALGLREKMLVKNMCELELHNPSLIGENVRKNLRRNFLIHFESEKELFTKLFVREYLAKQANRKELSLESYLSEEGLLSSDEKRKPTPIKLFEDFASEELKNDKDFAKVILHLEGSYLTAMGERIRNSSDIMEIAIANDTTKEVASFANSNSRLQKYPEFAILYFKKMQKNQGEEFSAKKVYDDIFKQKDNNYQTTIFKNDEQSSWMRDYRFSIELAKLGDEFVELISSRNIARLSSNYDAPKQQIKR